MANTHPDYKSHSHFVPQSRSQPQIVVKPSVIVAGPVPSTPLEASPLQASPLQIVVDNFRALLTFLHPLLCLHSMVW